MQTVQSQGWAAGEAAYESDGVAQLQLRVGCGRGVPLQQLLSFLGALYARGSCRQTQVMHLPTREQLRRLRLGELDLAVVEHCRPEPDIEMRPLFRGEPLAAFLPRGHQLALEPLIGPRHTQGRMLLTAPRSANPALHDQVMATLDEAGYHFRDVRELCGADHRDVLLAVAEGCGIAVGPLSMARVAGELEAMVTRCPLDPPRRMPDTMLAWAADAPPSLDAALEDAATIATEMHRPPGD